MQAEEYKEKKEQFLDLVHEYVVELYRFAVAQGQSLERLKQKSEDLKKVMDEQVAILERVQEINYEQSKTSSGLGDSSRNECEARSANPAGNEDHS